MTSPWRVRTRRLSRVPLLAAAALLVVACEEAEPLTQPTISPEVSTEAPAADMDEAPEPAVAASTSVRISTALALPASLAAPGNTTCPDLSGPLQPVLGTAVTQNDLDTAYAMMCSYEGSDTGPRVLVSFDPATDIGMTRSVFEASVSGTGCPYLIDLPSVSPGAFADFCSPTGPGANPGIMLPAADGTGTWFVLIMQGESVPDDAIYGVLRPVDEAW